MLKKLFNIILLFLFIFWTYMIISDYQKVKNDKKATFCIRQTLYDYIDGSVEECLGIGYKVYYYNRENVDIKTKFGPFWMDLED